MQAFLSRIMQTRFLAASVAAVSLVIPPFGFIGGGITGLAALRYGLTEGVLVAGTAMLLAGGISWFTLGTIVPITLFAIMTGLPVLLLATVLRITRSLATAITSAGFLGAMGIIGLHVVIDDPLAWWRDRLREMLIDQPLEQTSAVGADITEKLETLIDALAPMMAALPAGMVLGALLTLLLARWWHAMLDNPGGFGEEFRILRLPQWLAVAAVVVAAAAIFSDRTMNVANEFLQIFIVLYLFQGLAVIHGVIARRGASGGWLVALYGFGLLIPIIVTNLVVLAGLVDTWFDFRGRAAGGGGYPRGF
uniref:Predicted membrane protein (DUF2232) n=1 Tax=Candidatus Kentrum sp. DK TaxID=2126562 RepID=A0A450RYC6_9GAMM|nr:MAG: Predicted membrane protein (DUF2232) [Candidatus Kentron sp. DK]